MAIAAAAAQVHPSPPPPERRTVACTHLAWTAVMCLFLTSLWLFFLGLTAKEIGRLACGEGRAVVTAAYKFVYVAEVTLVLVLPFGLLVALMKARAQAAAAATDVVATKVRKGDPFFLAR